MYVNAHAVCTGIYIAHVGNQVNSLLRNLRNITQYHVHCIHVLNMSVHVHITYMYI